MQSPRTRVSYRMSASLTAPSGGLISDIHPNVTLSALDLGDHKMEEGAARPVCKLQKLDLNDCEFTGSCCGDLSSLLRAAPFLAELEISDNTLDDSAVRQLCEALKNPGCRLQKLGMGSCSLTETCCGDLATLLFASESLTELDLDDNELKDPGVKLLCEGLKNQACKIQKLEIGHCSLTDLCCEDLASALLLNRSLVVLDLVSNKLGDAGVRHLCESLRHPDCSLQKLRLINCSLTRSSCEHLASALSTNRFLTDLILGSNELRDLGVYQLCEGLKSPNCRLQTLGLWRCSLTSACCATLSSVLGARSSLLDLDLGDNELGDLGVTSLCQGLKSPGCKLRKLDLTDASLTGPCCTDLASLFIVNESLKELILPQNNLSDSGVKQLCEGLKHPNCKLQTLWLDTCGLTGSCCADVAGVLSSNQVLTELHLADNKLGDTEVPLIFEALRHPDCKIQKLWIWNCSLTAACCRDLASVLSASPSLIELEMCGNELGDAGVKELCEGLKHPGCKMQSMGIGSCSITDSCCSEIASVLRINQSLTELDLSDNQVGDSGMILLCEGFKHPNCKVPRLRLWMCPLTGSCCAALSSVLSGGGSLTELILSYSPLGDSGLKHLCEGLKHPCCKLKKLALIHCGFTSASSADLASVFSTNHSLIELDVADNKIGDAGVRHLCKGLKQHGCERQEPA
ncbi:ribonuclease inhibitor-like isoform X2 [Ambystoma mexicanum]|uniref:ribonuclease inhibitor-like isoform X2 n=1 Tax=Ambystoma mexicanum TaxID=8296 RepID=UPI0037E8AACD